MMKCIKPALATLLFILLCSCAGNKYLTSYQDLDSSITSIPITDSDTAYRMKLKPDDRLRIIVSSVDPRASSMFNLSMATSYEMAGGEGVDNVARRQEAYQTYLVDMEGNITLPVVGRIQLAGLTTTQAKDRIAEKLTNYIKDPIVDLQLTNFTLYFTGEINRTGSQVFSKERLSLLEAIAAAGDISTGGRKDKVTLIRKVGNENQIFHFDLTKKDVLMAQNFYMQQNDMIYVPPTNFKKRDTDESRQMLTVFLPIFSTLLSVISVLGVVLFK